MHASPSQLDSTLTRTWRLTGDWSLSGARAVRPAEDPATGAVVLVEAVYCAADGMATAQLAREIGALESLVHHPAVVPLLDAGRDAGWLYIVTAWPEGATLRDRLARDGAMASDTAVSQVLAIADALHVAHSLGIVHGAISTAAIVEVNGEAMLGRFGAVIRSATGVHDRAGVAGDVAALAAVLYELVTGTRWTASARIPDAVPPQLTLVLHRALGTDREKRFPTALALAQALVAARDGARSRAAVDGGVAGGSAPELPARRSPVRGAAGRVDEGVDRRADGAGLTRLAAGGWCRAMWQQVWWSCVSSAVEQQRAVPVPPFTLEQNHA